MIISNYHSHNAFCDGQGTMEEYMEAAMSKNFTALGFSSHAPLPVKNDWALNESTLLQYLAEAERLKVLGKGRIQIYKGLEIDYIPGTQAPHDPRWQALGLDFSIGSVHSTTGLRLNPLYYCIDGSEENMRWLLSEFHDNSFEKLSEGYYARIKELLELGGFSFLGHFDLIKKYNRQGKYFSENSPWYRRQVLSSLDVLASTKVIMEVNTGAISRGILDEVYPSSWILAEARKKEIPVMINADAHRPGDIDCYFKESRFLLREAGFRKIWALLEGEWKALDL